LACADFIPHLRHTLTTGFSRWLFQLQEEEEEEEEEFPAVAQETMAVPWPQCFVNIPTSNQNVDG
jgi:hypothetical protein